MKIGAIGDLHGKVLWKEIINENPQIDHWIFMGDYVDSFTHGNEEIIDNLRDIISYKQENYTNVDLLLGNHDVQYMFMPNYECSGFRPEISMILRTLFQDNKHLFNITRTHGKFLFSHAGISDKWRKYIDLQLERNSLGDIKEILESQNPPHSLDEMMYILFNSRAQEYVVSIGRIRGGFDTGGPLWADKSETWGNPINGFHQIVGHTPVKQITQNFINDTTSITYVDCLDTIKDFYTIEIK